MSVKIGSMQGRIQEVDKDDEMSAILPPNGVSVGHFDEQS